MPLVTVKPKFQATIPAKLRRNINLRVGNPRWNPVQPEGGGGPCRGRRPDRREARGEPPFAR